MDGELRYYPDPVLCEPSDPVEDPGAHGDLIDAMIDVLYRHGGVGLAAPQVGVSRRIFLLCLDREKRLHEAYVNPSIEEIEEENPVEEGCLSFPDVSVEIVRGARVSFTATTPGGRAIERTLEGLQAHCVQHEVDHLEGKTLLDHCNLQQKLAVDEALERRRSSRPEASS